MVIQSISSASLALMRGVQDLTAQAARGTVPVAFQNGEIVYAHDESATPAIAPFYNLLGSDTSPKAPGAEDARPKRKSTAGEIAKTVRELDGLMTTPQTREVLPGHRHPIKLLGQMPARQILIGLKDGTLPNGFTAAKLAAFARQLAGIERLQREPSADFTFLSGALLAGVDPTLYEARNEAALKFSAAFHYFERDGRYGAAALAAELGLSMFMGSPLSFRETCDGGEMWARSLSKAPLSPSPIEAFYHGLNYASRTSDVAAQTRLFASLGDWYERSKRRPLDAGLSHLRAASLLSPFGVDVTGEPKDWIDHDDAERYAVEIRRRLDRARRSMQNSAKGHNDLLVELATLSNAAIDIELADLRG